MASLIPRLIDLEKLIADSAEMKPLPQTVMRLSSILASEDWDLRSIVDTLRLDPPMTARLLRVANSAAYSPAQPISEVRRAVMHLGASQVASLAMGFAVRGSLDLAIPAYGIKEGELWRHSVASALATEVAGRYCKARIPAEAYVTALLHDIGKLILARHLTEEIQDLLTRAQMEGGLDPLAAEREVLTVHHGELGALVVQRWGLPESIVKGVMYHHTPAEAEPLAYVPLAYVTALADAVAKSVGAGLGTAPPPSAEALAPVCKALALDEAGFAELCAKVSTKLVDVLALYK